MNRTLLAFLLSFLVYLVPAVHAHGGTLLGLAVWAEFIEMRSGREPLWLFMDALLCRRRPLPRFSGSWAAAPSAGWP
jgi:hypothetical protein